MFIKPEDLDLFLDLLEDSCNVSGPPSGWFSEAKSQFGKTVQSCLFPDISKGTKIPTSTFRVLAPGNRYLTLRKEVPKWADPYSSVKVLNVEVVRVPLFFDNISGDTFIVGDDAEAAAVFMEQALYAAQKRLNYAKYKAVSNCSAASISSRLIELENEEKGEGEGGKGGTI